MGVGGLSEECQSHCPPLQQSAPMVSTPLPSLTGFTFSHSQTLVGKAVGEQAGGGYKPLPPQLGFVGALE